MPLPKKMKAARMHEVGGPMRIEELNEAISGIENRNGGFSNYVIHP